MKNYFAWFLLIVLTISFDLKAQNLVWAKRLGSKLGDSGYAIAVDADGNAYSTGSFSQKADFDPGQDSFLLTTEGQRDIYISKLDKDGNFVWAKQIGGKSSENAYAIALDASGFLYITGSFRDTVDFDPSLQEKYLLGRQKAEVFLAKYDFDGNFIWAQKVTQSLDTISSNVAYGVGVDPLGNAIVFGKFGTSADFNPGILDDIRTALGDDDMFISKYDASGNFIWVKNIGGPHEQEPYAIAIDGQGNIFCTGFFSYELDFDPGPFTHMLTAQDTLNDAFILKLNSAGEFSWVKQISGPDNEYGNAIAVDSNGNSYTGGSYSSLTDFNYGDDPVLLPTDSFTTGNSEGYILALDIDGNFRWVKRMSGPDDAEVYAIAIAPGLQGGLYVLGYFDGDLIVNDIGIPPVTSHNNSNDIFISNLDRNGNFGFLAAVGGTVLDFSQAIAVNISKGTPNVYSTGFFSGTCDFDPSINEFPLSSAGSSDIYVLKLEDFVSATNELPEEPGLNFEINPNPANVELEIRIPSYQSVKISIINSLDRTIQSFETAVENERVRLDVSSIPSGIYFIQLNVDHKICTKKFIISH